MNNSKQTINPDEELKVLPARKIPRILAFLLDLLLIGTFIFMFLAHFIIPGKYGNSIAELERLIQEYKNAPQTSKKETFDKASPELKEMIQVTQSYTTFILWIYFALSEILMNGSSLGKMVFSLRVVNTRTLESPSFFDSILRSGLKTLALVTWIPIFIVNFFLIFITKRNQAGHDFLTRTLVIEGLLQKDEQEEEEDATEEEF